MIIRSICFKTPQRTGGKVMKPAAIGYRARPQKTLLTAMTRTASTIAFCLAVLVGQANAKTLASNKALNLDSSSQPQVVASLPKISSTRLNEILEDLKKPEKLLAQGALSWPPQFAIGQTWTINTVGVGNWTLPLTTSKDGDAVGNASGTDKREGWFRYYPKSGTDSDFILNVMRGDNEIYFCAILPDRNPSGNTLNGAAYRTKNGSTQPEDLKTTCSATLGANSSSNPQSPFVNPNAPLNTNTAQTAGPVWPPKPGETWTLTIDGLAPWTINFEKLDKDGDPTGSALQAGAAFTAFAYKDTDGYVFETIDGKTRYDCVFTTLQPQGNAFVGGKAYSGAASASSLSNLEKSCSAAIRGGQTTPQAQQLSWPPQFAIGQTWSINTVGIGNWTLPLSTTIAGDATGYTTGTDKREGWFRYFPKTATDAELVINYLASDTETYLCGIYPKGNPTGNTLNGTAFRVKQGSTQPEDLKTTCSATLGANSSSNPQSPLANPNVPLNPNTNTSQATSPVWPPKPGENWTMTIDGLAPWAINFEKLDKDGDPTGTATQNATAFTAFAFSDTGVAGAFQMINRQTSESYYCAFKTLQVQGNAFVGGVALFQAKGGQASNLNKTCTAAIGSSVNSNTNTGGSVLSGIFGNANPNNTNTGLSWPVQVAPGQTWTVNVKNTVFQLKLERVNNGITIGTATANNVELAGGFATQGDNLNLILTDGTATIICTFGR
jgi:hypothetical protein